MYDVVQVLGLPDTAPKVRLALTLPNYAVVRGKNNVKGKGVERLIFLRLV